MLSYIVGIIAVFIFLANPISQVLFPPNSRYRSALAPRPQLNASKLAIDGPDDAAPVCPPDAYRAHVLRSDPLVVYLEGFLSEEERSHLLTTSEPIYEPSTVTHDSQTTERDTAVRDSEVALLPRTDAVRCIERRARAFQGWRRDVWVERLRTQRYFAPSGHYSHHFDFGRNSGGWGRVSSIMAWVDDGDDGVVGGGTEFPYLRGRFDEGDEAWCKFVECGEKKEGENGQEEEEHKGTTFKVVPGNAVYWENFSPDGRAYEETWHAGLPVEKGTKVGLNIWSFGRIE